MRTAGPGFSEAITEPIVGEMHVRRLAIAIGVLACSIVSTPTSAIPPPGTGCQVFPANNYWHADVRELPVHP